MTIQLTQVLADCQEQLQLMKTALCAKEADNAVLRTELATLLEVVEWWCECDNIWRWVHWEYSGSIIREFSATHRKARAEVARLLEEK